MRVRICLYLGSLHLNRKIRIRCMNYEGYRIIMGPIWGVITRRNSSIRSLKSGGGLMIKQRIRSPLLGFHRPTICLCSNAFPSAVNTGSLHASSHLHRTAPPFPRDHAVPCPLSGHGPSTLRHHIRDSEHGAQSFLGKERDTPGDHEP